MPSLDKRTLVLLVLSSLKHGEISEGRAVELLHWRRDKIRAEMAARVGCIDGNRLIDALDIMDSKGRHNPGGNSTMLWDKDWEELRQILLGACEAAEAKGGK